jgi:hypothetical protein
MMDASITFLNGDSFMGASTNGHFFWQALCATITYLFEMFMGFKF